MLETVYKTKQKRGYFDKPFPIEDTSLNSVNYFNILSVPGTFTAGKNLIKIGLNGYYLKRGSEFDLEVLDNRGESVYNEYTGFIDRYGYHYFIVYVYDNTAEGIGSVTFAGIASKNLNGQSIVYPGSEHVNMFNVKWSSLVDIKPTDRNITDIVFQQPPDVTVTQVLTPYKFNFGTYALNARLYTQSLTDLTLYTSENAGFDYVQNTSNGITDVADVYNSYNYFLESSTANTVETNVRKHNNDIVSGYVYSEYARYNTILFDSQSRLTKDMEGSIFSFSNLDNGASMNTIWRYQPDISSSTIQITPSGSLAQQLNAYTPKIVNVLNNKYALLDSAPVIRVLDTQNSLSPVERDFKIKQVYGVTGSFIYPTSSQQEVRSTNLSSSYIQFTFLDFKPIAGDVYRIKTYAKEAGRNAEYYQLNDHIVTPPELLVDSDKQNQAVYAKNKSDFFVYGEFTEPSVAIDYWRGFSIQSSSLYSYSFSLSSSAILTNNIQANALTLSSSAAIKRGATTRFYQTYMPNEAYTLSFYCTLDAGCELEVYMSSTPLKDTVLGLQAPRAFVQSRDFVSVDTPYSKLGKLIGKVSNISGSSRRLYDNVVFDFYPDADGFGRPVIYLNTNSTETKLAHISSVSITPLDLVGYTPSILQFSAATPDSINILQDDDASLTQSLDIKIDYFTADGRQSEYTTYIPNVQINMINEVPGFCTSEASKFNDHCAFYYEVGSTDLTKPNTGTLTVDPTLYTSSYFWPTYSLNFAGGYFWNLRNFQITGSDYASLRFTTPISSSITSSWFRYDPILPLYSTSPFLGGLAGSSFITMYSASSIPVTYSAAPLDGNIASNLSTDRRFYQGNGAAIDKYELAYSQSVLMFESNSYMIQSDSTKLAKFERYLRKSRLHFPTTSDRFLYGFHENGGIYNVRFKLSRVPSFARVQAGPVSVPLNYPDHGTVITSTVGSEVAGPGYTKTVDRTKYSPETGAKLMVYIADVTTPLSALELVPGRPGFFPPKNNIVTIGNGYSTTPAISWVDQGSGYNVDQYDIMLVQYGEKAQLVFDASGLEFELETNPSLVPGSYKIYNNTNQAFWGGVISDIEWCKIGVTTDTRFVKPANFDDAFNSFVPYTPPLPPLPPPTGYDSTTIPPDEA